MDDKDTLIRGGQSLVQRWPYFSSEDQQIILSAKEAGDLHRIAGDGAQRLFEDLQAYRQLKSEGFSISLPKASASISGGPGRAASATSGALAGAGLAAAAGVENIMKDKSYEGVTKKVTEAAEKAGEEWEEGEKKLQSEEAKQRSKGKTPKERSSSFASKEDYMDYHLRVSYDSIAASDPKKAKAWAQAHPDNTHLSSAIDRGEMWNKKLTFEEFEKIREGYVARASLAGADPKQVAALQLKASSELNSLLLRANPELAKKWAVDHGDRGLASAYNSTRERQIELAKKRQGRISKILKRDPTKKLGEAIAVPAAASTPPKLPTLTKEEWLSAYGANTRTGSQGTIRTAPIVTTTSSKSTPATTSTPNPSSQSPGPRRRGLPGTAGGARAAKAAALASRLAAGDPKAWLRIFLRYVLPISLLVVIFIFIMLIYLWIRACEIAAQYPFGQDLLEAFSKTDCPTSSNTEVPSPPRGVTIGKNDPPDIENGGTLEYNIELRYNPNDSEITVEQFRDLTVVERPNFEFTLDPALPTTGPYDRQSDSLGDFITWKVSDLQSNPNDFEIDIDFNIIPVGNNFKAVNTVYVLVPGGRIVSRPSIDQFLTWFHVYECPGSAFNYGSFAGCTRQDASSSYARIAYRRLSEPLGAQSYLNALGVNSRPINILFGTFSYSGDERCSFSGGGAYAGGNYLKLDGYTTSGCSEEDRQWSMIHELGHALQERRPSLFSSFPIDRLAQQDGDDCYDNGLGVSYPDGDPYIQTYRYRGSRNLSDSVCRNAYGDVCDGGGGKSESFGEALGLNVVCGPGETCQKSNVGAAKAIVNYRTACSNTFNWVRENIYGGIDFYN